jgi:hypothetical protein
VVSERHHERLGDRRGIRQSIYALAEVYPLGVLWTLRVVLEGWIAMFAIVMGLRIVMVTVKLPPIPDRIRVPFEHTHDHSGLAGGWICARSGQGGQLNCALLLATFCSVLEVLSLRLGWTKFEFAHSVAGIVVAPVVIVLSALVWT